MTQFWLNLWGMKADHSAVIQAIASIASVLLLIATVVATSRTLRVAMRQAEAAENAANLAIQQLAQAIGSQDKATQPLVTLTFSTTDKSVVELRNVGLGPAFEIRVSLADKPDCIMHCETDVLGVNQQTKIFLSSRTNVELYGLKVAYRSAHGRAHECVCCLDAYSLDFKQKHCSLAAEYDKLFGEKFVQNLH